MSAPREKPNKALSLEIPGARLTGAGWVLCLVYLGVPVLVLGNLADLLVQWLFGWCVGLWCVL